MKFPLFFAAVFLAAATALAGELAIYKTRASGVLLAPDGRSRLQTTGYLVQDLETAEMASVTGAMTLWSGKAFWAVRVEPLVATWLQEDGGKSYTVLARTRSPEGMGGDVVLDVIYARGKNASVVLGSSGPRLLPPVLTGFSRVLAEGGQGMAGLEMNVSFTLDVAASRQANASAESLEAAFIRLGGEFLDRGYTAIGSAPPKYR